jgi:hypothetical protein
LKEKLFQVIVSVILVYSTHASQKFIQKPQPEPMASAFQNLKPSQSQGEKVVM